MDLFNNEMVNKALTSMSKTDVENYKKIGEKLYGNINFCDSKIINNLPPPMEESIAYIEQGIKSGLLPEDLDKNEVQLLTEAYGNEWYLKYGFKQEEVPEIGLSLEAKKNIDDNLKRKINLAMSKSSKDEIQ